MEKKTKRHRFGKSRVFNSNNSGSPKSRYTASSAIIDRVILAKPLLVNFCDNENSSAFEESSFIQECLAWHNIFRKVHRVPPLQLSYQLCTVAQFWANTLAHHNSFYHRNLRDIGENLFCRWSNEADYDITGEQLAKYWYEEGKQYNFDQEPFTLHVNAGHFSQMVWRSSLELGIGKAKTRCGKLIVVANYKPTGNVFGEFQSNVFPVPDNDDDDVEGMLI